MNHANALITEYRRCTGSNASGGRAYSADVLPEGYGGVPCAMGMPSDYAMENARRQAVALERTCAVDPIYFRSLGVPPEQEQVGDRITVRPRGGDGGEREWEVTRASATRALAMGGIEVVTLWLREVRGG